MAATGSSISPMLAQGQGNSKNARAGGCDTCDRDVGMLAAYDSVEVGRSARLFQTAYYRQDMLGCRKLGLSRTRALRVDRF